MAKQRFVSSGLTVVFNVEPDDYPSWSSAINYGAVVRPRSAGLTVMFNVEPDDYPSWSPAINYGALIIINDPNDFPETSSRDTYVTIGTSVDIKVEPRVYQSEAGVRHASPAHRACWFHDEVVLEHTDRYSYETCVTECVMANFIAECGCTPYKYPRGYVSYRFCELGDLPCTYNVTVYGKRVPCDPPCYVECRDKRYAISKNTLPFHASDYPKLNTKDVNVNHLASIKVYFGKSSCSCYKLALLMDVNYFIATYGGVLGLSFGASLVTAAELVYLLVTAISEKIYLIRKRGKPENMTKVFPKRT
ncbi:pickpocket protein 11-like [Cydia splendana]|uniref:pickpocket protein 11-like n=1 Tax=Cydia splendana TaxID=1100963 RepID=UPI00300CAD16